MEPRTLIYLLVAAALCGATLWRLKRRPDEVLVPAVSLCTAGVAAAVLIGSPRTFMQMRLLAWGIFVAFPLWALAAAWVVRSRKLPSAVLAVLAPATAAVGVDAFLVEPHALELSRVSLTSPELEAPLRIAVLSDIQSDRIGAYERRALDLAMAQEPDLILLTGDYVQVWTLPEYRAIAADWRQLFRDAGVAAPRGVWAVQGNTEPSELWPELFEGLPVEAVEQTRTTLDGDLAVTALSFDDSFDTDLKIEAQPGFHVVFGHGPDFALGDVDADLLVAGHTHGGQVRLPLIGPLLTFSQIPRSWAEGATQVDADTTLVVSRGVGMERLDAPRLRFRCRPQVVIVDVGPEELRSERGGSDEDQTDV